MKSPTNVVVVTLDLTPLDRRGNLEKIRKTINEVRSGSLAFLSSGHPLLLFPELTLTGHGDDFLTRKGVLEAALDDLFVLLPETAELTAAVGLPLSFRGKIYNVMALLSDGEIVGFFPSGDVNPSGPFTAWRGMGREAVVIRETEYSMGRFLQTTVADGKSPARKIAFASWPELGRVPLSGAPILAADLILLPEAVAFRLGLDRKKRKILEDWTRDRRGVTVAAASYAGNESGTLLYDGGAMIARDGVLIARSERFWPGFLFDRPGVVAAPFSESPSKPSLSAWEPESWENGSEEELRFEEFSRAVAMGLFDYLKKCRAGGFVLSLSGGADSGAIAALVRLMVLFGVRNLAKRDFLGQLAFVPGVKNLLDEINRGPDTAKSFETLDEKRIVAALLTTVYQGAANSGEVTRTAARKMAEAVGATHYEFQIAPLVDSYRALVEEAIGRPLSWATDDLALQNIQARVRAPSAWFLANLTGALLLMTGNRSEGSVGYATMDGDTCGSIAPIAGVSKDFLRHWLRWMEKKGVLLAIDESGGETRFSLPEFSYINAQQPTAELRPPEAGQTDEGDLMPYSVLDIIERGFLYEKLDGPELLAFVRERSKSVAELATADDAVLGAWIDKFRRRWRQSEWKRRREPQGFVLDDYALGEAGTRYPLLSGGE